MASRSVTVNFANNSDVALIRDSGSLSHGIWTVQPPGRIEVGTTVSWESESSGVLTGTEGEVTYKIETGPGQTDGSTGTIRSWVRTATTKRCRWDTRQTARGATATMRP